MANLPEVVNYDAGVYQLEVTDIIQGGPSGKDNVPLKNLANRTAWLKAQIDAILSGLGLPVATPSTPGVIKVGTGLSISDGVLSSSGKLLRQFVYLSGATWTKQADMKYIVVEAIGGGANATAYINGGDGGYTMKKIDAALLGATETVSVGAAGGGNSSFGSHCAANGGSGQAGGSASGGDLNITGMHGFGHTDSGYTSASPAGSGRGGQSYYGGGGDGGSGRVIVKEYS